MNPDSQAHVQSFLRFFIISLSNARMYTIEHPQAARMLVKAYESLAAFFKHNNQLSFMLLEDHVILDEMRIPSSLYTRRFAEAFRERGCSHIKVLSTLTLQELGALVKAMAVPNQPLPENLPSIVLGTISLSEEGLNANAEEEILLPTLKDLPQYELEQFLEIQEAIRTGKRINVSGLYKLVGGFINAFRQEQPILHALIPLRLLDEYTYTHSTNVCMLNLAQAISLGIEGQLLHDIGVAALLHDIGKLAIPEEILTKPDKLNDEEWQIVKEHPIKGVLSMMDSSGIPRLAIIASFEHHLKYNLSGYPPVNTSWQQNICSHMTTISDFFDAMRTKRPYREPVKKEIICKAIITLAGTEFHPTLAKNFVLLLDELEEKDKQPDSSTPEPDGMES